MNVTYEREIGHCGVSPYVKVVTIKNVSPAQNSDFLDRIEFSEMGQNAIAKRGQYSIGDQVLFIPPESVLPYELTELLEITGYTSKGRIRITKLRGNRSEGLIVDPSIVEPWIPYILKWEDPPSAHFRGDALPQVDAPYDFRKFFEMPNILNEPFTFQQGEELWYSEKIHGTNMRFGVMPDPNTGEYLDYVGSHNVVLKESDDNVYWQTYNTVFRGRIPRDLLFFCEVFGNGIQHLTYGRSGVEAAIFAIMRNGEYIDPLEVVQICTNYHLPVVFFHQILFNDLEEIRTLADTPSEITDKHHREGIVLVSAEYAHRMAKCIGETYWTNNQGKHKKKRTERH